LFPKYFFLEPVIAEYQDSVRVVFDKYLQFYFAEYPGEKNPATANNFFLRQNDNYRKEVTDIAIFFIRKEETDDAVISEILVLNDINTTRLRDKITELSK